MTRRTRRGLALTGLLLVLLAMTVLMRRGPALLWRAVPVAAAAPGQHVEKRAPRLTAPLDYPLRGLCWEGARRIGPEALAPLPELGVSWISQTPFGWVPALDSPQLYMAADGRVLWGESDAGLVETARLARARGVRTLLKPHLWVRRAWVGQLEMRREADWQAFFGAYETFIVHYAALAQRERFEALAVGTELMRTTRRSAEWRRIIARVRQVYGGPLTYCAAWNEVEAIDFWGDLDFIGVQAYYPLGAKPRPEPAEIRTAWAPIATRLEALAVRTGRPIVFTEAGYKSLAGGLGAPWEWSTEGDLDLALQRDAYQALFDVFWGRPWFGGTFIWKWHPHVGRPAAPPERHARDFTPQGKPALDVLQRVYTRAFNRSASRAPRPAPARRAGRGPRRPARQPRRACSSSTNGAPPA